MLGGPTTLDPQLWILGWSSFVVERKKKSWRFSSRFWTNFLSGFPSRFLCKFLSRDLYIFPSRFLSISVPIPIQIPIQIPVQIPIQISVQIPVQTHPDSHPDFRPNSCPDLTPQLCGAISCIIQSLKSLCPRAILQIVTACKVDPFFCAVQSKRDHPVFMVFSWWKLEKPYIRFYFHHDNHGEESDGIYGENTTYIIFSPYMVNVVYTIHGENKRNPNSLMSSRPKFGHDDKKLVTQPIFGEIYQKKKKKKKKGPYAPLHFYPLNLKYFSSSKPCYQSTS